MVENYQVLPSYKRFNQKFNSIMRSSWDPALNSYGQRVEKAIREHVLKGDRGFDRLDFALYAGCGTVVSSLGTGINRPDSGLTSWEPLSSSSDRALPFGPERFPVEDPARTREAVAKVARHLGVDLVGFTELDMRWVYSHHYLPGKDLNPPVEIPEGCRQVVVMGVEMDYEMMKTAPTAIMMAETQRAYSRMSMLVGSMAQFIRTLGYRAIPCLNDTALSVPLAIDAGLAQPSRMGLAVTEKYGPRVRFCKVITDLPLGGKKQHADFGVLRFCEVCNRCAEACPVKAVPTGPRTMEGLTISNSHGVLKWYLDAEKCRRYFAYVGTNCGICLGACPFNKGRGIHHTIARWMVRHTPLFNRFLLRLHDWLGYGKPKDPGFFWGKA